MKTSPKNVMLAVVLSAAWFAHVASAARGKDVFDTAPVGSAQQAWMHARYDGGPAAATKPLRRMQMVLRPGAGRRAALDQFLASQQNPRSADYRRWLTPEQFAERFGALQANAAQVAAWLQSAGMTNVQISRGRLFVAFSGTAGTVESAFHTAIHVYNVHGQQHYANVTAPSIPAALMGTVADVIGLHDFNPVAQLVHFTPPPAQYAAGGGANYLGPDDLATIYNMKALYARGITGNGIRVAVLGQTPIALGDYRAYRQMFGLAANDFQAVAVPGSGAGTGTAADLEEATLDTETTAAVARNASIVYVWGATAVDAAQYVVDNQLAQVMSLSYAGCENGSAAYYQAIARQANAEGITWVSAAGDSGAAGCDAAQASAATSGLAVMSPASVPEVTAVGGTACEDGSSSQYWSPTNDPLQGSALSYVPETGWSNQEMVLGGGGGVSQMFAKAGYQSDFDTAITSGRMVPDVALAAAPSPVPYLIVYNGSNLLVGGTSAAAPVLAGIAALVNHYQLAMGNIAQPGLGNINPELYLLAEKIPGIFHDVTAGSNDVPCTPGTPDCATGRLGYPAASGYDEATGLGSVDAYALASNWANATLGEATLTLATSTAQTQASQSVTLTARVSGDGGSVANSPVTFYYSNPQSQAAPVSFWPAITDATGTATIGSNIFPAGSNFVTADFGGSSTVAAGASSNSVVIAVSAFPTATTASVTGTYRAGEMAEFSVIVSAPAGVVLGGPDPTDAHYAPGSVSLYSAEGTLQSQSAVGADGTATLNSHALAAGNNAFYVSYSGNYYAAPSQSPALTLSAESQAGTATTTKLNASSTNISFGTSIILTAQVSAQTGSAVPTGTVTFYNGATALANSSLNAAGSAAITLVPAIGTASMTAVYGGSSVFNSSTSAPVTVTAGNMEPGDFSISGPNSAIVATGSSTAITLSLTPLNGFDGTIVLSCTGLPAGDTCTLPGTVTPQGATPVAVTIATAQASLAAGFPLALFGIVLAGSASRRRKFMVLAALAAVLALAPGCGSAANTSYSSRTSPSPSPSQTFTATVTATSGSISHQFQIDVTVEE